jgi:hypothetical protein
MMEAKHCPNISAGLRRRKAARHEGHSLEAIEVRAAPEARAGRCGACPGREVAAESYSGADKAGKVVSAAAPYDAVSGEESLLGRSSGGCTFGEGGQVKKTRGRWHPTPEQISVAIDCAVARMPITRAAGLIGIGPRTLWLFAKRAGSPGIFEAWKGLPARVAGSRTAEAVAPVRQGVGAGPAGPEP